MSCRRWPFVVLMTGVLVGGCGRSRDGTAVTDADPRRPTSSAADRPAAADGPAAAETAGGPRLTIEPDRVNLGVAYTGDLEPLKAEFVIRNRGDEPLEFEHIHVSCGCLKVAVSDDPLPPGKEGRLIVAVRPAGKAVTPSGSVTIQTNDPENRRQQVRLVWEERHRFALAEGVVELAYDSAGDRYAGGVDVLRQAPDVAAGDPAIRFDEKALHVRFVPNDEASGAPGEVVGRLGLSGDGERLRQADGRAVVKVQFGDLPELTLEVNAARAEALTVEPRTWFFGAVAADFRPQQVFEVSAADGAVVSVKSVEGGERLRCRVLAGSAAGPARIEVVVPAGAGVVHESVRVVAEVAGEEQVSDFTVSGVFR